MIYLNSIIESASKEIRSRVGAAIITGCVLSGVAFSQPSQTISSFSNTQAIEVAKTAVTKGTGSGKQNPLDLDFAEVRAILHVNTDVKYFDENLRRMLTPEKIDLPPQFWFVWFCECKYRVGYKGSRTGVILEHPSGRVVSVTPYL